ncbi:hypothetical protein P2P98_02420 [Microbacterium sp. Kw_RZR3]|uniref:hypothetical protein n=1 Tax=Microbacterium sp. Kw_RZR3 TaxID=3032903 RepID=UPI0023DC761B|nr:hypothetical protein [Microbacterium sp. Kw_RZR3]MDF2045001.1 hypothetical protein [Microbacterium sp. Kw_RZR3]
MKKSAVGIRVAAAGVGCLLLSGVASAAFAVEEDHGVAVNVDIAPVSTGALTLTVDGDSTSLTEVDDGNAETREFWGTLPTVTVNDTRDPSQIPADTTDSDGNVIPTAWYVEGQASAFTKAGSTDVIGPENLGWMPDVTTDSDGTVAPGDGTVPALDDPTNNPANNNNVGLKDKELFAIATSSAEARAKGTAWTATATLKLKTPQTVAAGSYTSTLTISLFE